MSRTTLIIFLGDAASLMVLFTLGAAVFFGRSYFMITDSSGQAVTPVVLVETAVPVTSLTATATIEPTTTRTAAQTATAAPTVTTVTTVQPTQRAACTDAATYIADVTIPDGTQLPPDTRFTKTWRLKNSGTCTWDSGYRLFHQAGSVLDAGQSSSPLPAVVAPGQTVDLSVNMASPSVPGSYQSDWLLQNAQGRPFGVGRNSRPFWVKIGVASTNGQQTVISGLVYQDANENGTYDNGEVLMGSREIRLIPGACRVMRNPVATTYSGADGRFTLAGEFNGGYCVGVLGDDGLKDAVGLTVTSGQTVNNVNLNWPAATGSIGGYLWSDYCLTDESGDALDGSCVADGSGDYHADGMIEPTETYIAGVLIQMQLGACANNNNGVVTAVTDNNGRYTFGGLQPVTYCISMNAAEGGNGAKLLPGDWTFPARGIWYQEITLSGGDHAYPVNFGWDYQLK